MKIIKKRINKHYHPKNKNWYWHLAIDGILLVIIITLITTNISISTNNSGNVLGTQNDEETPIKDDNKNDGSEDIVTPTSTDKIDETILEQPIIIKATNIDLKSAAKYYTLEGEQLGIGPLPPIVGQSTKYWVFINIENFDHDLENISISATIAENVSLTGKTSVTRGKNITINENSKEITWQIENLEAKENQQLIGAGFEISVTPLESQSGKTIILLDNINLSATDIIVNKQITKTFSPTKTTEIIQAK